MLFASMLIGALAVAGNPIELQWDAPPGCPTADEVAREVEGLFGEGGGKGQTVQAEAQVAREGEGYRLELVVTTRSGRDARSIHDPRCEPLAHATALVVATLMDPIAVSEHIEALSNPTPPTVEPPAEPPPRLPEPPSIPPPSTEPPPPRATSSDRIDPRPPPRPAFRPSLRLGGFLGSATLPGLDGGLAVAVGFTRSKLRLELGASYAFPQSQPHPELAAVGLQLQSVTGQLRGCYVPAASRWEFPLCVAGDIGAMLGRGEGSAVLDPTTEVSLQLSALAEAHVVWRATDRVAVWLGAQGVLNLARPSFTVDTLEAFFTTPIGGGRAKLGLELRFP